MYYGLGLATRWLFAGGDLASGTPGGTMDDREIMQRFQELWADLRPEDTFAAKKPLLAHYTTIQTLEKILASNEVWFSNPLFMNDFEEVRFAVLQANEIVLASRRLLDACKT